MNEKLKAILNCIKDSETILGGEYYVIHSDYIIALEEELNKLNLTIKNDIKVDYKRTNEEIKKLLEEIKSEY